MKRNQILDGLMFVLLVLAGAVVRVWLQDLPNFAPVAALALFAGYYFRSWPVAAAVPLSVMAISDWQIGGYDLRMMAVVYGMLAAPVALRSILRRHLSLKQGPLRDALRAVTGLVACSLGAACLFFLVTNFASWLWFGGYARSGSGLVACYYQALPFFRYTLAGDLMFSVLLFGGFALATQCGWAGHGRLASEG